MLYKLCVLRLAELPNTASFHLLSLLHFILLNELNRKMQGSDNNVITHTDTVKSCIDKL